MPLYEYQCRQCGHRFERIQSFSAPDVKECPVCGGAVERLISAPAIRFKGSGFYQTDYGAKPSGSPGASSDSSSGASASAPAASGGDGASKSPGASAPASSSGETK